MKFLGSVLDKLHRTPISQSFIVLKPYLDLVNKVEEVFYSSQEIKCLPYFFLKIPLFFHLFPKASAPLNTIRGQISHDSFLPISLH